MSRSSGNIILRKIEKGVVYSFVSEAVADVGKRLETPMGKVFTDHYRLKCEVKGENEISGILGELLEANGENRRGFYYRVDGQHECILMMDPAALLAAAQWAHEGEIPQEAAAPTEKVSAIDQRLASELAKKILRTAVTGEVEDNDDDGAAPEEDDGFVELIKMGPDASKFLLKDDSVAASIIGIEATTHKEGIPLGKATLIAPEALFVAEEGKDEAAAKRQEAARWNADIVKMVRETKIAASAIIAQQEMDFSTLSQMKPGEVIPLRGATLEAIALVPENEFEADALAVGAVRSLDGMRKIKVIAADTK